MTAASIESQLEALRATAIGEILSYLEKSKAKELEFTKKVVYMSYDDQFSDIVDRLYEGGLFIDNNSDYYEVKFEDITNDVLLKVLELLEQGKFVVYEDAE